MIYSSACVCVCVCVCVSQSVGGSKKTKCHEIRKVRVDGSEGKEQRLYAK